MHLSNFHLRVDLFLLKLVRQLLLTLLCLVKRYLLLQCVVFHLLVLEHQGLDLPIQLLEYDLVLLYKGVQIRLLLGIAQRGAIGRAAESRDFIEVHLSHICRVHNLRVHHQLSLLHSSLLLLLHSRGVSSTVTRLVHLLLMHLRLSGSKHRVLVRLDLRNLKIERLLRLVEIGWVAHTGRLQVSKGQPGDYLLVIGHALRLLRAWLSR